MSLQGDISNHPAYIRQLRAAGGQAMQAAQSDVPPVEAGLFDYPVWETGREYAAGDLFMYCLLYTSRCV